MAVTGGLVVGLIYVVTQVIAFLQPLLIPFAVAGVMAYLLEPVVVWLGRRRVKRQPAVWIVFLMATTVLVSVLLILIPAAVDLSSQFGHDLREDSAKVGRAVTTWVIDMNNHLHDLYGIDFLHLSEAKRTSTEAPIHTDHAPLANPEGPDNAPPHNLANIQTLLNGDWLANEMPTLSEKMWDLLRNGVGGFLGVFGFLISLIIIPLYLYYFLTEGPKIAESWPLYVPLRASQFKDEFVNTITDINRYLIAFFRGQLVVSMINGLFTAVGLSVLGLKFGWLIGLSLCFLGIVPYVGVSVCWLPSVIIASVQHSSWLIPPTSPWWLFPLSVTAIFVVVQNVDSLFVTPHIVGDSVGLHPMTVIVSVVAWSLVFGGLLGAILAVPMTAALKVLFQRFIWRTVVPHLKAPARAPAPVPPAASPAPPPAATGPSPTPTPPPATPPKK